MPIKKLESGGYEVRYDTYDATGKRKQHRRRFDTSREAKDFQAKQTLSGEDTQEHRITIKQWFDTWLDVYVKPHKRIRTYERHKQIVDLLLGVLNPNTLIGKMKRVHIQGAINKLMSNGYKREGKQLQYTKGTIDNVLKTASGAFRQAVLDGYIKENPCTNCITGGLPPKKINILDEQELKKLLGSLHGNDFYTPVFIAAYMGLCLGEVAGLKWADIDFTKCTLTVNRIYQYSQEFGFTDSPTKTTTRSRTLPMPKFVASELKEEKKRQAINQMMLGESYIKNDYVCKRADGKHYNTVRYCEYLRKALEDAGLPHITFHGLRHGCISLLLSMGVPLPVVSEIAGHSNTGITARIYAHALKGGKQQAADVMDKIYNKN